VTFGGILGSQNITKLLDFLANEKLVMYTMKPWSCFTLNEPEKASKSCPNLPSRPACAILTPCYCVFLATSPAIFRSPAATTYSPQHPAASLPPWTAAKSHTRGPMKPQSSLHFVCVCCVTGCVFGGFASHR